MIKENQDNRYEIVETIAKTQNYIIRKAIEKSTGDNVIIKSLAHGKENDQEIRKKFLHYARNMKLISHKNVRKVFEIIEDGNNIHVVEQYIKGKTLAEFIKTLIVPITIENALDYIYQIMDAVQAAHELRIVHGQLNPDCIYLTEKERILVDGFGKPAVSYIRIESANLMNHPIYYLAPELLSSDQKILTSDVYSIGVILYQLLTNRLPWHLLDMTNPLVSKEKSLSQMILDPSLFNQQIPFWLFSVIRKALQVVSMKRFQSISEFADALKEEKEISTLPPYQPPIITDPEPLKPLKPEPLTEHRIVMPDLETLLEEEATVSETPAPDEKPNYIEPPEEIDFTSWLDEEPEQEEPPPLDVALETLEEEIESIPVLISPVIIPEAVKEEPVASNEFSSINFSEAEIEPEKLVVIEKKVVPPVIEPPKEETPVAFSEAEIEPELPVVTEEKIVPPVIEPPKTVNIPRVVINQPVLPPKPVFQYKVRQTPSEAALEDEIRPASKMFRIIAVISVVVILITIGKYYFEHRNTAFSPSEQDSPDVATEVEDTTPKVKNEPIGMISISGSKFVMGSMESNAAPDEFPIYVVEVPNFFMSKYETTQKEWMMVFGTNPSASIDSRRPVDNVSFFDVVDFCNAKSELDGFIPCYEIKNNEILCDFRANGYRLPTEAEWEFATKAGIADNQMMFAGSNEADVVAWYADNSSNFSHPVGQKSANPLGLHDLTGNVWEWCWNFYTPYSEASSQQFTGPPKGSNRVLRGGSYQDSEPSLRNTKRHHLPPWTKAPNIGFRLVRTL